MKRSYVPLIVIAGLILSAGSLLAGRRSPTWTSPPAGAKEAPSDPAGGTADPGHPPQIVPNPCPDCCPELRCEMRAYFEKLECLIEERRGCDALFRRMIGRCRGRPSMGDPPGGEPGEPDEPPDDEARPEEKGSPPRK